MGGAQGPEDHREEDYDDDRRVHGDRDDHLGEALGLGPHPAQHPHRPGDAQEEPGAGDEVLGLAQAEPPRTVEGEEPEEREGADAQPGPGEAPVVDNRVYLVAAGVKIIFNYSEALLDVPSDVAVHTSNPAVDLLYALYFHLT